MNKGTGGYRSRRDIRTFSYPTKSYPGQKGGVRYETQDIEDQGQVGICTANSIVQNARKALGIRFSPEFQYLCQKKYFDNNWEEGSSIFSALKVAKGIGFLPIQEWKYTADRDLPYDEYIAVLKSIPEKEISRMILIANQYRIKAYASVPTNRDAMARAIDDSRAGILSRYELGEEWYTDTEGTVTWFKGAIEPLRPPKQVISGHAVTDSNYDGNSFRIANTWSPQWADNGTAYRLHSQYRPTECWAIFYDEPTDEIQKQLEERKRMLGRILDAIQKLMEAFRIV